MSKNKPSEKAILNSLTKVVDPDLRLNIVELGLVYGIRVLPCQEKENQKEAYDCHRVEIDMTLTSPACPIAPQLQAAAHQALLDVEGVKEAHVDLVFSPPWDPRVHASEDARMDLGIF